MTSPPSSDVSRGSGEGERGIVDHSVCRSVGRCAFELLFEFEIINAMMADVRSSSLPRQLRSTPVLSRADVMRRHHLNTNERSLARSSSPFSFLPLSPPPAPLGMSNLGVACVSPQSDARNGPSGRRCPDVRIKLRACGRHDKRCVHVRAVWFRIHGTALPRLPLRKI